MCGTAEDITKFLCAFFRVRKQTDKLKAALEKENAELIAIQFKFKDEDLVRTVTLK